MVDRGVATYSGERIGEQALEDFEGSLRGEVIHAGDEGYDEARKVWNGMIDSRPALIVRCQDTEDVRIAIDFARTNEMYPAVRGGGHNIAGRSMVQDSVVIDLSPMKKLSVDANALTARADGGLTLGEFDRGVTKHGLVTTLGTNTTTGIAGLTLGGGYGWLAGKYGMACDNLISAEVVTADGRVVTANADENADLYWGLRGGGGNFGVVTRFDYRVHRLEPMLGGRVLYPATSARDFLGFYHEFASECPDELMTMLAFLTSPDGVPMVGVALCYCGSQAEGEKVLEPLRTFGSPAAYEVGLMNYTDVQAMLDPVFSWGRRCYWKTSMLPALNEDAITAAVEAAKDRPSPLSVVAFQHLHGAATRVPTDETAFSHRYDHYNCIPLSMWLDPAEDAANIEWARRYYDAMEPHSTGIYSNDLGEYELEDRDVEHAADGVNSAYGNETGKRLKKLKDKYDPTNFFRFNANIAPSSRAGKSS